MRPLLTALLFLSLTPAFAAESQAPLTPAERQEKLDRVKALRDQSAQIEREADARYKEAQTECWKKFLVSDCLAERKKEHTAAIRDSKNKSIEAGDLEREVKRRDLEAKEAKKAAEAPGKAAEQEARSGQYRAEEAAKASARSSKVSEKQKQAAEGRKKRAAEEEARQRRNEERARRDAEQEAKRKARTERPVPVPLN